MCSGGCCDPAAQERRCGSEAGWRAGTTRGERGDEKAEGLGQTFTRVMQNCLKKGQQIPAGNSILLWGRGLSGQLLICPTVFNIAPDVWI